MLEVLRAFESPRVTATGRVIAVAAKQPLQLATISWGAAGAMPVAVAGVVAGSGGFKIDTSTLNTEVYRITDPVRIENPDDSDQFVMVDRIKAIGFKKKKADEIQTSTVDKTTGTTTTSSGKLPAASDYKLNNV